MGWWVADLANRPSELVSWIIWVIGSIVLHELAHGWAAIRCGDRTPIETGHMTWNPLVHMGGMSLLVFAMVGIAWGQMPVTPRRFRGRNDDAFVAFAGPAMNLVLAVVAILLGGLWVGLQPSSGPLQGNVTVFFLTGAALNIVLMLFNLLPIPPLDGSTIASTYSGWYREMKYHPYFQPVMLLLFVLVFFRVSPYLFRFAYQSADSLIAGVSGLIG